MVISNVGLFSEGFDLPALEVAIIARPTASLVLHLQMIGRIMRSAEGKDGAVVLDHTENSLRHGLVTDDREWSLDDTKKRKPPSGALVIRTCRECYLVVSAACHVCPGCGSVFRVETVLPKETPGELVRQESFWEDVARRAKSMHAASQTFQGGAYRALLATARMKGRREGWAAYVFKARFHRWPTTQGQEHALSGR